MSGNEGGWRRRGDQKEIGACKRPLALRGETWREWPCGDAIIWETMRRPCLS